LFSTIIRDDVKVLGQRLAQHQDSLEQHICSVGKTGRLDVHLKVENHNPG